VNAALQLWRNGYPEKIRKQSVRQASIFEAKTVTKKWIKLIKGQ
jgi:hypothetical protein